MWRADASITAGVYNTKRKSAVRATSAELWDSTDLSLPHLRLVLPVSKTLRKLRWVGRSGRARREVRSSLKRIGSPQAGFEPATLRLTVMQVVYPVGSSMVYLRVDRQSSLVFGSTLFTDCSLS